jgi:hypothetical protein
VEKYKSIKGSGVYFIIGLSVLYDVLFAIILFFINSYEISILVKIVLIAFNIYQIYYLIICASLNYFTDDEKLYINSAFGIKKINIPFSEIQGYTKAKGNIRGIKLSGYGKNHFAIGRAIIEKIGITYMFVTSTKNIIYLKTEEINYGLSPEYLEKLEKKLNERDINPLVWEYKVGKNINLNKDKKFFIPFIIATITTLIITLNPIILYLYDKLPNIMPLYFSSQFGAVKFGTGKEFAFKHMVYGVLNMALILCMYYAAYFCARYDRKSAYKFIYIPLGISIVFLIMQVRILFTFR